MTRKFTQNITQNLIFLIQKCINLSNLGHANLTKKFTRRKKITKTKEIDEGKVKNTQNVSSLVYILAPG